MSIILLLLLLFSGCKKETPVTHFQGTIHTHPYHIQIGQSLNQNEKNEIITLLDNIFENIDIYYNHWNPYSELSQVNQLLVDEIFPISPHLLDLIEKAKHLTQLTNGHFDPTYGSFISIWKEALQTKTLPLSTDHLLYGWETFSFEQGQAKRLIKGSKIDLDGLLKGLAIDEIVEALIKKGYQNIYVEWGGDMRTLGRHPSGRNWMVSLPIFENDLIPLTMALATSGNKEQSCEIEGVSYSHIIIPETKKPLPALECVSVQAKTCLIADALATALMTFPSVTAVIKYLKTHQDTLSQCIVWIYSKHGEIYKWENIEQ